MIQKTVLENGVRVVSESQPHAFSATVGLWMEVGSRDEVPLNNGISHFIEHMAFKGTGRRGALDIAREIDRLGGMANAFTSRENTCFHCRALAERLPEMCDLLTDIFLHPALDPLELERERGVILQEIGGLEDAPDELVHVLFGEHFWPGHPLGRSILGSQQTIEAMDRQAIASYLESNYLPCRAVISAVGSLEHQQVVDLVGPVLSKLPANPEPALRRPPDPRPGLQVINRDLEQVHVALGLAAPHATSAKRYQAAVLNLILGGNMSSRLFQEVRERRGLAYAVYSYLSSYSDSGLLGIYLGVAPERVVEALKVVRQELAGLAAAPVSEQELADSKENLRGAILLAAENPESRMSRLARNEYNFGRDVPLKEALAQVQAVTQEDVASLAGELLAPGNLAATVLGPVDEDALPGELAW
ncbi:MAG: pitrilysin family protein [Pseudomonadota bacterium]